MTRVLIVEDHALFADVIRVSLTDQGMDVLPPCRTGADAITAVERQEPDLVLLDIGLPDRSGLSVGRQILQMRPHTRVVALTAMDDPRTARRAIRAGFHGYLTKDVSVPTFIQSVQAIVDGGQVVVPQRFASALAGRDSQETAAKMLAQHLTAREREVLGLLVEGYTGPRMARSLRVSPHTIRTHIQSILMKLQVHSRLEAVAFAVKHGIVLPPTRRGARGESLPDAAP